MAEPQVRKSVATEFTLFTSLPQELQDHIWDLAVRPLPGDQHLHQFFVVDHYFDQLSGKYGLIKNGVPQETIEADFIRFEPRGVLEQERSGHFGLGVPHSSVSNGPNTSAYMLDSGLWKACRQSRAALERFFKRNEWWSDLPDKTPPRLAGPNVFLGQPGVSHTASYIDPNRQSHHITITEKDLIHIKGLDAGFMADWHYHYAGDKYLFNRPHDLDYNQPHHSHELLFLGQNVALDFNPEWLQGAPGHIIDMLEALYDETQRTIWFIDYRLRRINPPSSEQHEIVNETTQNSHREVFYSWGSKFIEVKEEDKQIWEVDENSEGRTIFNFIRESRLFLSSIKLEWPRARVLACEVHS